MLTTKICSIPCFLCAIALSPVSTFSQTVIVQESFETLYFSLILSKYCAKRYSNGKNYLFVAKPQMMFAAFVIYGFNMFESALKELSGAYERFFRKNMQEKVDEIGGTPVFKRAFK